MKNRPEITTVPVTNERSPQTSPKSLTPHFLLPGGVRQEIQRLKGAKGFHSLTIHLGTTPTITMTSEPLRRHIARMFEQINGDFIPVEQLHIEDLIDLDALKMERTQNIDFHGNRLELNIYLSRKERFQLQLNLMADQDLLTTGKIEIEGTPKGLMAKTQVVRVEQDPQLKKLLGEFSMKLHQKMLEYLQTLANMSGEPITHKAVANDPYRRKSWEAKFGPDLKGHGYARYMLGMWVKTYQPEPDEEESGASEHTEALAR